MKTVLITGASSGIGMSTAILLSKKGFKVYAAARRIEKMEKLKDHGINILKMDVTDEESMQKGVQDIIIKDGSIDILINNAGYGSYGALEDVSMSEAKYQFEVNVFGLARLTQLALPYMRKNKYGKIINVSSIGGKIYEPMGSWYHATKFAVEGLSDCLRTEVKDFGIDVIVIEPGGIKTEWEQISIDHLLKVSGNKDYKEIAKKSARLLKEAEKMASSPDVIAKVIAKSIIAKKPKTRYAAGAGSWTILFLRKILSDRLFDRLLKLVISRA